MTRNLPSLNALLAFEAAARLGSFTAAAEEMHVTPGAVSRQIKALEEELGLALFRRLHRQVELTEAGRRLAPAAGQAFDLLNRTVAQLKAAPEELRIKVQSSYAVLWLIPRLHRFQAKHPDLQIRLTTSNTNVDFTREEFEAGLTYGRVSGRDLIEVMIHQERMVPVCSPALVQGRQALRRPEDLSRVRLLHNTVDKREWRAWAEMIGLVDFDWTRGEVFETDHSALRAAAAGFGVALGNMQLIETDLEAGRLVRPFDHLPPLETGAYYLVYPAAQSDNPALKAFEAWLKAEEGND